MHADVLKFLHCMPKFAESLLLYGRDVGRDESEMMVRQSSLKSASRWSLLNDSHVLLCRELAGVVCTGWAQKFATLLLFISLPIIDRFSKFYHWHTLQTICDNVIIIDPTIP